MSAAVVTSDPALAGACRRLALVAGAPIRQASPAEWSSTPPPERVVLIGPDVDLRALRSGSAPQASRELHLVCAQPPERDVLLAALSAGVRGVAVLPADEAAVVEALTRSRLGANSGRLVAVVGASGGVGASTLALAATMAVPGGLAVDLDEAGPGLDAVAGLESAPGPRWSALVDAQGAVSVEALRAVLPVHGGATLLGCDGARPPALAVSAVVSAWRASGGDCVVDLPRWCSPRLLPEVCRAVLVVAPDVPGILAARRVLARCAGQWADIVVVRRGGGGLSAEQVADALEAMDVRAAPWRSRLMARTAAGLPAPPDNALVRFAAELWPS